MHCSYNKSRADFPGLKEWGDYEEQREDISETSASLPSALQTFFWPLMVLLNFQVLCAVYNLSQGLDVEATQKKVEEYEKANSDEILRNQAQKVRPTQQLIQKYV